MFTCYWTVLYLLLYSVFVSEIRYLIIHVRRPKDVRADTTVTSETKQEAPHEPNGTSKNVERASMRGCLSSRTVLGVLLLGALRLSLPSTYVL